jgi:hypothetical protein
MTDRVFLASLLIGAIAFVVGFAVVILMTKPKPDDFP